MLAAFSSQPLPFVALPIVSKRLNLCTHADIFLVSPVTHGCTITDSTTWELEATHVYYLVVSVGHESRAQLALSSQAGSHRAAVKAGLWAPPRLAWERTHFHTCVTVSRCQHTVRSWTRGSPFLAGCQLEIITWCVAPLRSTHNTATCFIKTSKGEREPPC